MLLNNTLKIILIFIVFFNKLVHRQAATAKTVKEGRRIDAKHVRRKQLNSYLPVSVLQRNKRLVIILILSFQSSPIIN